MGLKIFATQPSGDSPHYPVPQENNPVDPLSFLFSREPPQTVATLRLNNNLPRPIQATRRYQPTVVPTSKGAVAN